MRSADEIQSEIRILRNMLVSNKYLSLLTRSGINYAIDALVWVAGDTDTQPSNRVQSASHT